MHKFKRIILSAAVLSVIGSGGEVYALDNEYSNQLLKLNVDKSGDNDVNVTVYTSKPYKLKVTPVKRSNGEYVIFLPETYHSITAKPDVSSSGGAVDDVDVKLVPDTGSKGNNGYTKITVKMSKDVNVNLDNRVINPEPVQEDDLSNLINGHGQPTAVAPVESKKKVKSARKHSSHKVVYTQTPVVRKHKERPANTDFLSSYFKRKPVVKAAHVQIPKKQDSHKQLVQVKTTNSVKIAEAQEKPVVVSNPVQKPTAVPVPQAVPSNVTNPAPQVPQQVQQFVTANMPTAPTPPNSAPNYPVIIGGFLALLVAVKMFKKPKPSQSQSVLPPAYTPDYTDDNVYRERDKSVNPILARLSQGLPERPTRFSTTAVEEDHQYYQNEPQQEEYYDDNSFFSNQSYEQYDSTQADYDSYLANDNGYYENDNSYRYNPEERDNLEYLTYIPQEEQSPYAGYQTYDDAYEENYDYQQEQEKPGSNDEYHGHFQIQHDEEAEDATSSIDDIFDEFVLEHSEILEQTQQLISETTTDEYVEEYESVTPAEPNSFSSYLEQEEELELPVEDVQEYEEIELSPVLLDTAVQIDDDIYVQEEEAVQDSPEVIDGYEIAENRGFYLIQTDESKSLIGVIGSEVFLLNSFSSEEKLKLAIKKSEKKGDKDLFFVKTGKWQGLVSVTDSRMALELAF